MDKITLTQREYLGERYYYNNPDSIGGILKSDVLIEGGDYVGKDVLVDTGYLDANEYTVLPNGNYYIRTKTDSGFIDTESATLN